MLPIAEEEFGDIKWVIKIRKSKDRQHNDQKKKNNVYKLNNTSTQLSFDYRDILCQQEVNRI